MKISEARPLMGELILEGHVCPVCTRMAKVYKRKIHKAMAKSLIDLYKANGTHQFVHWSKVSNNGDFAMLRHWNIIKEESGGSGKWKITSKGKDFLKNYKVPKYAMVYDGDFIGLDDSEFVSIQDCLGDEFNLEELMQEVVTT
jgi:hypothetical protein